MKRKDKKSEIYKSVKSKRKAIRNVGPSYSLGKDSHLSLGCYFDSWLYFLLGQYGGGPTTADIFVFGSMFGTDTHSNWTCHYISLHTDFLSKKIFCTDFFSKSMCTAYLIQLIFSVPVAVKCWELIINGTGISVINSG